MTTKSDLSGSTTSQPISVALRKTARWSASREGFAVTLIGMFEHFATELNGYPSQNPMSRDFATGLKGHKILARSAPNHILPAVRVYSTLSESHKEVLMAKYDWLIQKDGSTVTDRHRAARLSLSEQGFKNAHRRAKRAMQAGLRRFADQ